MRGYKHIAAEFAEGFAAGDSIQIASYAYYRAGEGDRVDPLEGIVKYEAENVQAGREASPEGAAARVAMGLPAGGFAGSNIVIDKFTVRHHLPPAMLFCCSAEPDLSRVTQLGEAIFEISDLHLFAHRLFMAAYPRLWSARLGPVIYGERAVNPFEAGPVEQGPFFKSVALQHERELRIVWHTLKADAAEPMRLAAPKCRELLSLVAAP
jgi:hypothetical protein